MIGRLLSLGPFVEIPLFMFAAFSAYQFTSPYFHSLFVIKSATAPRSGIEIFRKDAANWRTSALGFSILHYCLGVVGIAASSLAAAHPTLIIPNATVGQVVSWIAALTTALITFFGAQAKAMRLREAAARLEAMIGRYDIEPTYTFDHVAETHDECMKLLKAGK